MPTGKMRVILWTITAIVSSIANSKFLLWQNDPYFAYRHMAKTLQHLSFLHSFSGYLSKCENNLHCTLGGKNAS